jgi:hypothetical protein
MTGIYLVQGSGNSIAHLERKRRRTNLVHRRGIINRKSIRPDSKKTKSFEKGKYNS